MREDLIEIENGTITTKDGLTLDIGKGWFVKEPSEEMEELYKDIEPRRLHSSDIRMSLAKGYISEQYFEKDKDAIPEELREWLLN